MEADRGSRNQPGQMLEDEVAKLFTKMHYNIYRNVSLTGRSGQCHQVDLFFEYCGHTFIVECKTSFLRANVLSIYGMITDLDIDHVFLITRKLPMDMMEYSKRFNLTPIVLEDKPDSRKNFENIVSNTIHRTIKKIEAAPSKLPVLEITSFYFEKTQNLSFISEATVFLSLKEGECVPVSEKITRIDFYGSPFRSSQYIKDNIRNNRAKKYLLTNRDEIVEFIERIENQRNAQLFRYGIKTDLAYIVTNLRYRKDQIGSKEITQALVEKDGELTSLTFRLTNRGTLYINQSPTLCLRYNGRHPDLFFKARELFENSFFRRNL